MEKTTNGKLASSATKIAVLFLVLFCVFRTDVSLGQDIGLPDSVYFGEPSYSLDGCTHNVRLTLPVYLWSDQYSDYLYYVFRWQGDTECDTVHYFLTGDCDSASSGLSINHEINGVSGSLVSYQGGTGPTIGTEKLFEFIFHVGFGDTIHAWFPYSTSSIALTLGVFYFMEWKPSMFLADTQIVMMDTILVAPGDADASRQVTISDAVYLIQYIFAGGCAPFDAESADADGSCLVTISDAVYLINYVFAGGPPPQAGCVVP